MRYTAEPRYSAAYYGDFRQRIVGHVNSRIEARTIFRQYIQIHQFAWHLHNILKTNLGSRLGHPSLVVGVYTCQLVYGRLPLGIATLESGQNN